MSNRLYRVSLLRSLGLSLSEIKAALDDPTWQLRPALAAHLTAVDERLEQGESAQTPTRHVDRVARQPPTTPIRMT